MAAAMARRGSCPHLGPKPGARRLRASPSPSAPVVDAYELRLAQLSKHGRRASTNGCPPPRSSNASVGYYQLTLIDLL
jgi:hypothetical protein